MATKKYPICECLNILKNLWVQPTYRKLTFTNRAYYKMIAFINLIGDYEISGFARIQKDEKGEAYITDVDILKQKVRGAYVEASDDAVMDFLRRIPTDQYGEWTLDWHSHVNMSTRPSSTDWNNYAEMLTTRMGKQFPFMIINKKEEITAYQYISEARQVELDIFVDETPMPENDIVEIYNECKEKVETLCQKEYDVIIETTKKEKKKETKNPFDNSCWDLYNDNTQRWWEYDDDDDDFMPGKVQQLESYEDDGPVAYCAECYQPLDLKDPRQAQWGVCDDCLERNHPELL